MPTGMGRRICLPRRYIHIKGEHYFPDGIMALLFYPVAYPFLILGDPGAVSRAGRSEKARRKFSNTGGKAPGFRLSPDHFQTVKRMLAPDWAQKMLCIIVPNRRTVSSEFFSLVGRRRLLSRHSCLVCSPRFPNQERRNY